MPDNKNLFKFEDSHLEAINVEWEITDFLTSGSLSCHPLIFSFAKNKWMLYVSRKTPRCMWLKISNITRNNEPSEKWKCKFGLKETGGDMLHFTKSFIPFTTSRGELLRLRNDQTFPNNITILCTLQYICDISEPSTSRECAPLKLIKFDALTNNFKRLLANKDSCDVILHVKETILNAHKAVLMARSPVFTSMFHHDTLEKETGIITISDCDPDAFLKFLEYLYSGELDDASFHNIQHLYIISDKYDVQELKSFCTECMEKCFTECNICDIVKLADMYNEARLFSAAQVYFNKNAYKVVETAQWKKLMKNNCLLANSLIKGMI